MISASGWPLSLSVTNCKGSCATARPAWKAATASVSSDLGPKDLPVPRLSRSLNLHDVSGKGVFLFIMPETLSVSD